MSIRGVTVCLALLAGWSGLAGAATKTVDLDGQTTNGAESKCDLNVLSSFPVTVENVVTNKTPDAFDFSWASAGPGGFTSSVPVGSTAGVGAKWTWSTNQTVYAYTGSSCANDICFLKTSQPNPDPSICSSGCLDDGVNVTVARGGPSGDVLLSWTNRGTAPFTVARATSASAIADPASVLGTTTDLRYTDQPPAARIVFYRVGGGRCLTQKTCASNADCVPATEGTCMTRGPFAVPGRSLAATSVTVSAASLTSSLITFFGSPLGASGGNEVFRVTSTARPGGILETLTNLSNEPVSIASEPFPPGCCPETPGAPHQIHCEDGCKDYLTDPENCGGCGNVCGAGTCCTNGYCASLCDEGTVWCDGECVDLQNDSTSCGACGSACGEGTCCSDGGCASLCDEDLTYCPSDGKSWEYCADVQNDTGNCGGCGNYCDEGECCSDGGCVSVCSEGRTWCGYGAFGKDSYEGCADLQNDSENCGSCGNYCEEGTCCLGAVCVSACPPGRDYCDGLCYDLGADEENCGECGVKCSEYETCDDGVCIDSEGDKDPTEPVFPSCPNPYPSEPTAGECPNPDPWPGTEPAICPNEDPSYPIPAGECGEDDGGGYMVGGPLDAPICRLTEPVPPGGSMTTCDPGGVLFKEVLSAVSVCGASIPGPDGACNDGVAGVSTGTFMRLVRDDTPVGNAYVVPYAVHVLYDSSGDGMVKPGETASLGIELMNAGLYDVTDAVAVLSAPTADLSVDGLDNPVGIEILEGTSSYGTIQGTPRAENCEPVTLHPASNAVAFRVKVPLAHPGDTAHPLRLTVHGTVLGEDFSMDVPLSLGIADGCFFQAAGNDYDGLEGRFWPVGKLVPVGDEVPVSTAPMGSPIPLELRLKCGGVILGTPNVVAPEIVGLTGPTGESIDLATGLVNQDTNSHSPVFRWDGTTKWWSYRVKTTGLAPGRYTVRVRIAGRKDYQTGFVLQ